MSEAQLGLDSAQGYLNRLIRELQATTTEKKQPLLQVLEYLSHHIRTTRDEIGALRPDGGLSSAADELEEIVGETAKAANAIMGAAETIETIATRTPPDIATELTNAVTLIYEASAFQDITGQRITKALRALQEIEGKIQALSQACESFAGAVGGAEAAPNGAAAGDAALLNGPQLGRNACSQSDIDALFDSFNATP
jgi:chemotaxis protein CheZ